MTSGEPLLSVRDLVHEFHTRDGVIHAVSGVSFDVHPGETLGIVGETGSGKSTLARSVLQAPRPTSGSVLFRGTGLTTLRGTALLQARRHLQMVFQDPFGSLDPKWRVRDLVEEPLIAYRTGDRGARRRRVDEVLELVGLDEHVQGGDRLVADDQRRVEGDGARDGHPLGLAAGQLPGPAAAVGGGIEADQFEHLVDPLAPGGPVAGPVGDQRFGDQLPDDPLRVQRPERVLEHHLQVPAGR